MKAKVAAQRNAGRARRIEEAVVMNQKRTSSPEHRGKLGVVVLADQVKNIDWRVRKTEFICKLPRQTTYEVLGKLGTRLMVVSWRIGTLRIRLM